MRNEAITRICYDIEKRVVESIAKEYCITYPREHIDIKECVYDILAEYIANRNIDSYFSRKSREIQDLYPSAISYGKPFEKSSKEVLTIFVFFKLKEYATEKLDKQYNITLQKSRTFPLLTDILFYLESPYATQLEAADFGSFFLSFFAEYKKLLNVDSETVNILINHLNQALEFYRLIHLELLSTSSVFHHIVEDLINFLLFNRQIEYFYARNDFITDLS